MNERLKKIHYLVCKAYNSISLEMTDQEFCNIEDQLREAHMLLDQAIAESEVLQK